MGYNLPKISIVTPNYNGAAYLEETILSVLNQKYPNLEYIIVDGGSSDDSLEIIKKYEQELACWISEPDRGMYDAIQKGFNRSTGEIMAWINSDDMYHKNVFYTIADVFSSFKQVNWLVGATTIYDEQSRTVATYQSRAFTKFDFYNYDFKWIQQESVFWRRIIWEKSGSSLNTNLKYAGDFDLWLKFFQADRLFIMNALIGGFRYHSTGQLSRDFLKEYLYEANQSIRQVPITKGERKYMFKYKTLIRLELFFKRIKLVNAAWLIRVYRSKFFYQSPTITFDRESGKFELSE